MALALLLGCTLIVAWVDRFVALPASARVILLVLELTGAALLLARPLQEALRRRVDWVEASEQIERRNRSLGQRLVTVTSQLLAPPNVRGSQQMLDALMNQVSTEVESARAERLVEWRSIWPPALLALCVLSAAAALWSVSWLNLPQLVDRQLRPFSGTPPVTTTQIDITPANPRVAERQTLVIRAVVHRLSDARDPTIYVSSDGRQWEQTAMTPAGDQAYTFTIPAVDRDFRFYVTAGDATTPTHMVSVLRQPAVAEFRIRYSYPAYTGRASLTVHNTDGLIEAPQGSEAALSVVSTEPLNAAAIRIDGARIEMSATGEANVRQARLNVDRDHSYELEMTSDRGVEWSGARQRMQIRAVPDRAPLVRLVQPMTDLRLSPREILTLSYQALDDYGVSQLSARAQVNANAAAEYPLRVRGDARRVEGAFDLDLASLGVKVGDVVSVTVTASDRAGQHASSDVRHVLVSPRSIDGATHQRLAELSQALEYARDWADQLAKAQRTVDEARKASVRPDEFGDTGRADQSASLARTSRVLSAAMETGAMLRQSLMRVIVYSASPRMSDALALAVDAAAAQIDGVDRVDETISSRRAIDDASAGRLARAAAGAKDLANQIKQLFDGEQAAAVSADRANLKATPSTAPTDAAAQQRRKQTLDRAKQDINAALAAMKINPKDPSVDAQLQQRVDAAARIVAVARPIDFVATAQRWAAGVRGKEFQPPHLDERLAAAAQVESVRPDAELVAARDLQLASRAAAALADPGESEDAARREKEVAQALEQYPAALAALRAEHDVNRRALRTATPAEARKIHEAAREIHAGASAARGKMIGWAAGASLSPDELAAKAREAEELALAANAATQEHDFDKAAELDRKLAAALGRPELAEASAAPRQIDKLSRTQEQVADQTQDVEERTIPSVAGAQKDVAEEIARTQADPSGLHPEVAPDATDARQKATQTISQAQERLASLPMQLLTAQQAAAALAEVSARLSAAQTEASNATPDRREAAQRVVGMVQSELDEAQRSFDAAAKPFAGRLAEDLAESVRPFAPDTSGAIVALDDHLKGAMGDLREALAQASKSGGGDVAAAEQAAKEARDAIAQVQESLREAQAKVVERDPLVSARWFARAAAEALSTTPPNRRNAAVHQKNTIEALNKAAADALRRSKNVRLAQTPGYSPFYLPPLPGNWGDADGRLSTGERLLQTIPGLREWGRLHERMGESLDAPVRESEPQGYSESLRIYFEVLGREDAAAKPARDGK